jgi:hypothetical protein
MSVKSHLNVRFVNERLRLISGTKPLLIEPCDGGETIAEMGGVFSYVDSNFKHWGCDVPEPPTAETRVQIYQMARDGTFQELFGDFGVEADWLSLTQAQIGQFVKHHPDWLAPGGNGTFFLFKARNEFFVAAVYLFFDGRIGARARRFLLNRVFRAGKRHRLVVPKLTLASDLVAQTSNPLVS